MPTMPTKLNKEDNDDDDGDKLETVTSDNADEGRKRVVEKTDLSTDLMIL